MDVLLLIKELLANKELVGMFLFTFIILLFIFRDIKAVVKGLRKIITSYVIVIMLVKMILDILLIS
jgi:hypothetical protein